MQLLDLCSGIGVFSWVFERHGFKTVGFSEIDPFCCEVLRKHWPQVPQLGDIRNVRGADVTSRSGAVDVVCGGFPCQQISSAGKGEGIGTEDAPTERSGLWWQCLRLVREVRPRWCLFENVPALRTRGADAVLGGLEAAGYSCWAFVVGAWAVGAPHRRDRVWIVAVDNATGARRGSREPGENRSAWDEARRQEFERRSVEFGEVVADSDRMRQRESQGGVGEQWGWPAIGSRRFKLANAASGGLRADGGASGNGRHPGECGEVVADADSGALRHQSGGRGRANGTGAAVTGEHGAAILDADSPRRGDASEDSTRCAIAGEGLANHRAARPSGPDPHGLWPAGRGQPQHPWEEPRTITFQVGSATDGPAPELVRDIAEELGLTDAQAEVWYVRNKVRIERAQNRHALRAQGNTVVPQVVDIFAAAIAAQVRAENA